MIQTKGKIFIVKIGSKDRSITIGGNSVFPFLDTTDKPTIGLYITDKPEFLPKPIKEKLSPKMNDLVEWAKYYTSEYPNTEILEVQFSSIESVDRYFLNLMEEVKIPLIISGSGDLKTNTEIIKKCGELGEGRNLLLRSAELENYKTITATALAYNHSIVAENPIDVNIAKQLNILLTDMGLSLNRIIIDPVVAALGYGLEYTFSVMERIRSATLDGDQMLSSPIICFVYEGWKAREALTENSDWGSIEERGIIWEVLTASSLIASGADVLIFKHPDSAKHLHDYLGGI